MKALIINTNRDKIFKVTIAAQSQSVSLKAWRNAWKDEMVKIVSVIKISRKRILLSIVSYISTPLTFINGSGLSFNSKETGLEKMLFLLILKIKVSAIFLILIILTISFNRYLD